MHASAAEARIGLGGAAESGAWPSGGFGRGGMERVGALLRRFRAVLGDGERSRVGLVPRCGWRRKGGRARIASEWAAVWRIPRMEGVIARAG